LAPYLQRTRRNWKSDYAVWRGPVAQNVLRVLCLPRPLCACRRKSLGLHPLRLARGRVAFPGLVAFLLLRGWLDLHHRLSRNRTPRRQRPICAPRLPRAQLGQPVFRPRRTLQLLEEADFLDHPLVWRRFDLGLVVKRRL
jgi:hypothetical protein